MNVDWWGFLTCGDGGDGLYVSSMETFCREDFLNQETFHQIKANNIK